MKKISPGQYLTSLNINVMHFGLEAVTDLLNRFGHPQNDYPTVLIGGTNGKGSTAAMLASMLREAGYCVGLYTSPHLTDVRERVTLNGKKIPASDFGGILAEIRESAGLPITYFEALSAAAFIYFQRSRVDIAVVEVGLGGRLDATNVCKPLVSVITNIGLEHMDYLGKTLTAIATEKAGIIKPDGVCLTGSTQKSVLDVLQKICRQKASALYRLGRDFHLSAAKDNLVHYTGLSRTLSNIRLSLSGAHQRANAALALAAIETLSEKGFPVSDQAICDGLTKTRWPGRMEILQERPVFILDGAHNPAGMRALTHALKRSYPGRRFLFIFSALKDKDYRAMLNLLAPLASALIIAPLATGRALGTRKLAAEAKSLNLPTFEARSISGAIRRALSLARPDDIVCAAGSLYLAGEVKQAFSQMRSCGKA